MDELLSKEIYQNETEKKSKIKENSDKNFENDKNEILPSIFKLNYNKTPIKLDYSLNNIPTKTKANPYISNIIKEELKTSGINLNQMKFDSQFDLKTETKVYPDGSKYEGQITNYLKNGKGKLIYPDGSYYNGNFLNDMRHGRGAFYSKNGTLIYQGNWAENLYNGYGVLNNMEIKKIYGEFNYRNFDLLENGWEKFEGDFKKGKKDGFGILLLSNGEKYAGIFTNNFVNGMGHFTTKNGENVKAFWENNHLVS